ncbi:GTP cyclohydrolase 1 type 2/Nif3 [Kipferlia bialata]|uniref:GTP cyclohydrolase 1 type 2/Nif3 n=1 Tax=Kipferlia bialata TaxID=797122 RepID=A0A9K3CQU3_9EUKA|nr:GTP cyclohydrolase 1 type 2/Nif3 [Kipferlia bialata]|eukprot:g1615.t1
MTLEGDHYMLTFYVPTAYKEIVKNAAFAAGGGTVRRPEADSEPGQRQTGQYDRCCFEVVGTGQFRALEGADPFIGQEDIYKTTLKREQQLAVKREEERLVQSQKAKEGVRLGECTDCGGICTGSGTILCPMCAALRKTKAHQRQVREREAKEEAAFAARVKAEDELHYRTEQEKVDKRRARDLEISAENLAIFTKNAEERDRAKARGVQDANLLEMGNVFHQRPQTPEGRGKGGIDHEALKVQIAEQTERARLERQYEREQARLHIEEDLRLAKERTDAEETERRARTAAQKEILRDQISRGYDRLPVSHGFDPDQVPITANESGEGLLKSKRLAHQAAIESQAQAVELRERRERERQADLKYGQELIERESAEVKEEELRLERTRKEGYAKYRQDLDEQRDLQAQRRTKEMEVDEAEDTLVLGQELRDEARAHVGRCDNCHRPVSARSAVKF